MKNTTIRPATPSDAAALTECIKAAYADYSRTLPDLPAVSEGVTEDIAENIVWVVLVENKLAGGISLRQDNMFLHVQNVAVDPEHAGQGLGTALMAKAEEECRRLGLHEMRLATHVGMKGNVALYQHLGWVVVEYPGNKVMMRKHLLPA